MVVVQEELKATDVGYCPCSLEFGGGTSRMMYIKGPGNEIPFTTRDS